GRPRPYGCCMSLRSRPPRCIPPPLIILRPIPAGWGAWAASPLISCSDVEGFSFGLQSAALCFNGFSTISSLLRQPFPRELSSLVSMQGALPADKLQRMAEMFEKNLGRELTPEELRYLGLSASVEPIHYLQLQGERRRDEREKKFREKAQKTGRASLD